MVYGIIAAGAGSRLRADGFQGFKPMVQIAGEALIQRLIRIFQANNATSIYIILNNAEIEVGQFIESLPNLAGTPIKILYKDTPSSFHSFYALANKMAPEDQSAVCISTIDPVFREEAFKGYIDAFKQQKELDGLMAVTSYVEDDKPLHVYIDPDFKITKFASDPLPGQPWISGGIYLFRNKALQVAETAMQAQVSKMRNYQQALLNAGLNLKAYDLGRIIDIDHVSDIALAKALLENNLAKREGFGIK
ncbi:hypothetical protein GCM10027566_38210 [Arachidicoccus ginsenosidivorans]|jgi:NDP-sugar pyrophosphorylase family protein|uniref:NDP-sugar synthase n=1 Tax=Arachidicoccus ginsenosidivorans TaxID=496057 RepID=A0A5B8VNN9_9BACT|nr:sugar phosphate nucleotidyltransferase [Arachidicoccus ginsenosidivorans]QEC73224.1 NDP-sugar synthase [Arachidicoccus ginsenosidivorans]